MLRSMYSGVSGMRGFQAKLDVIGNNIANVNTYGFKGSRIAFSDLLSQTTAGVTAPVEEVTGGVNPKQIGLGVGIAGIDVIHTPGSAMTTNYPLDMRIDGDGFFMVKANAEQAEPFLTRAGNFSLDALGQLVNADGMFVVTSAGEPITIPTDAQAFSVGANGQIEIVNAAGETEQGAIIGVTNVINPGGLEKIGGNLYRNTPNASGEDGLSEDGVAGQGGIGSIITGALEMSNVDLTAEFTEMIVAQRGFQSNARIITTSDEVLQEVVNLKR
jgi:flagellar hook protein FlgE